MANSALLVMDVQRDIVDIVDSAEDGSGYLPRLRGAIDGARSAGIPVIYVVIGLRPGHPEVGTGNRVLPAAVQAGLFTEGAPGTAIHHDVAPRQGDIVVTKRRASAFSGSDLDLADACLDTDREVHQALTERLFPQWADVVTVQDWLKAIAPQ